MRTRKTAAGFIVAISIVLAMTSNCLAGDMNANESTVYSAASGTFQYEGQTYKAAPEYLAQLQAYLCRDDIDLTADQASAAIAEMNGNVAKGVTEGYIIPVGDGGSLDSSENSTEVPNNQPDTPNNQPDTPDNQPDTPGTETQDDGNVSDKSPEEDDGKNHEKNDGNQKKSDKKDNTDTAGSGTDLNAAEADSTSFETKIQSTDIGKEANGSSVVTSNGTIYGGVTDKQRSEMEAVLSTRTSKDKASAEITYDKAKDQIILQTKDGTVYQLPDDIDGKMFGGLLKTLQILGIILCLITAGCAIGLFVSGSMKFQKKKPAKSSHRKRKEIRRIAGILLSIVLTVDIFGIGGVLWAQMSYFDDSKLLDSLSSSGYYHEAYGAMMKDVHSVMNVSGCMEDICDDVLTYENFMFATKNQIQLALQGRKSSATYEDVKTKVVEALDGIDYFTQDSKEKLGAAVLVIYQSAVQNVIGDVAYRVKGVLGSRLRFTVLCMAVSAIISVLLVIYSERFQHRGMRKIANACCFAGLLVLIIGLWLAIGKPYVRFYIMPDYLYLFFVDLIKKSVKILANMSVLLLGIGVLLHLSAYGTKKSLNR